MNYLALCQRLRQEAGISGTGPSTVTGQTGEYARVVSWVAGAYEDVQRTYKNWRFLRTEFSFSAISGVQEYTPAAVSLDDLAAWKRESVRVYDSAADETELLYVPWDDFRRSYKYGSNRTQSGRPTVVSIQPSNSLILWPIPDAAYTVNGEYYKTADTFADNTDEPIFDDRFHMIIVWKALMHYGGYEAADEAYARGEREYNRILARMQLDCLDDMTFGEPLA
uniref:Uncharacterized protein n=1 Tax=viral metagenome TaxID=1070528 RepID=A0A6M3K6F0_9ZZZZ